MLAACAVIGISNLIFLYVYTLGETQASRSSNVHPAYSTHCLHCMRLCVWHHASNFFTQKAIINFIVIIIMYIIVSLQFLTGFFRGIARSQQELIHAVGDWKIGRSKIPCQLALYLMIMVNLTYFKKNYVFIFTLSQSVA